MTREEAIETVDAVDYFGMSTDHKVELSKAFIHKLYDDFENKSCIDCRWCILGGEFENDECHNTSLSAHLEQGTMVSQDFCCNRWEARGNR